MSYHIATSSEPFKEGDDLYAVCGELIPRAAFKASMDDIPGMLTSLQMNLWGMCRKCRQLNIKERFVYVICSGQEAMTG